MFVPSAPQGRGRKARSLATIKYSYGIKLNVVNASQGQPKEWSYTQLMINKQPTSDRLQSPCPESVQGLRYVPPQAANLAVLDRLVNAGQDLSVSRSVGSRRWASKFIGEAK